MSLAQPKRYVELFCESMRGCMCSETGWLLSARGKVTLNGNFIPGVDSDLCKHCGLNSVSGQHITRV